jgi:hypothetical protein
LAEVTPEEIQQRFDRLTEIFSGIVTQADAQACSRCPYRNRHDVCTAKFRCHNQLAKENDPNVLTCGHNGTFDYRSAWESDPRATDIARDRIARQQRRPGDDPAGSS